jgi:L,D-peptidoglycan transpeptidase YkuD (ErfK/YbiS/YcfS/YnhG family)
MRLLLALLLTLAPLGAFELTKGTKQAVIGITNAWDSSHVAVSLYRKNGRRWELVAGPWQGRVGKKGLAWGRGIHTVPNGASTKREGDWKSPAGVFHIGGAWGYDEKIQRHPKLFYRQVTTRDLWVEDPKSRFYNQHIILDHEPSAAWEKKAQMNQDDYPHSLKLFIAHNAPPQPVPGAGSSIFFHIWRGGGAKPTSGCTTLPEPALRQLVASIDPTIQPVYILLPKAEYEKYRRSWKLP